MPSGESAGASMRWGPVRTTVGSAVAAGAMFNVVVSPVRTSQAIVLPSADTVSPVPVTLWEDLSASETTTNVDGAPPPRPPPPPPAAPPARAPPAAAPAPAPAPAPRAPAAAAAASV